MLVVQNGVDVNRFKPDSNARESVRNELDLPPATPLVALVGRWNPQKDLGTFFEAAARIMLRIPNVRFVLLGAGLDHTNRELEQRIDHAGIAGRCLLLGYREDVPRVLAAMDVTVSSSRGEGFPNAIAEAMACGSLSVATDVGESAFLLGNAGIVVAPQDPHALSAACLQLLLLDGSERQHLQILARQRIEQQFSLVRAARHYADLYQEVVGGHPISRSPKCAA
jgi:glycosyltransferase involved in cell wall biosynthesis